MRLSNFIRKEEENTRGVLNYEPRKLSQEIPTQAQSFMKEQPDADDQNFRMNELISKQTGIFESEKKQAEEEVNKKVLERVQEFQEKAYKEAYDLGLKEGTKKAFETNNEKIAMMLEEFSTLLASVSAMKKELHHQNESNIVDLVYYCAEKLVHKELEKDQTLIPNIIKDVIESLDSKENISIRINDQDFQGIQVLMNSTSKDLDTFNKIKFHPSPEIQKGGCIFETDHGLVDATLEERFKKLWDVLNGNKPA